MSDPRTHVRSLQGDSAHDGYALHTVGGVPLWLPAAPPGGTSGQVLTKASGTDYDVAWATPSGGGGSGITYSYLGYNTIGTSTVALVGGQVYLKKITIASTSMLLSVDAYIANTSDTVSNINAAVHADVSGSPERLLAHLSNRDSSFHPRPAAGTNGPGRWYSIPLAMKLPAGDYWVGVWGAGAITLAFDTGGSDRFYASTGGSWFADVGRYTLTTTSNKYSIRASIGT